MPCPRDDDVGALIHGANVPGIRFAAQGEASPSGESEDYGVQGQPHARPHHGAVDADELQIAP
jgi:hypothetical protein